MNTRIETGMHYFSIGILDIKMGQKSVKVLQLIIKLYDTAFREALTLLEIVHNSVSIYLISKLISNAIWCVVYEILVILLIIFELIIVK